MTFVFKIIKAVSFDIFVQFFEALTLISKIIQAISIISFRKKKRKIVEIRLKISV